MEQKLTSLWHHLLYFVQVSNYRPNEVATTAALSVFVQLASNNNNKINYYLNK